MVALSGIIIDREPGRVLVDWNEQRVWVHAYDIYRCILIGAQRQVSFRVRLDRFNKLAKRLPAELEEAL